LIADEEKESTMRIERLLIIILSIALLASMAMADKPARRYIESSMPAPDARPFSGAVLIGDTLYLSGDIGLEEGNKVPADAKTEAKLVLDSMEKTLAEAGMTLDDLVFVQVFCSDVAHYADFNTVYRTRFKKEFPARAFIGAGKLLFGARFEVQGIAVKR
jgi:2-iminobutanoate/2-iminopropanoate deaminase